MILLSNWNFRIFVNIYTILCAPHTPGQVPHYLCHGIIMVADVHDYNIRHSENMASTRAVELGIRSF